jgi:mono/diheme cytochrome c family protein
MSRARLGLAALAVAVASLACTQQMTTQPYYRPYTQSQLFSDGTSARPIPADTVSQGQQQVQAQGAGGESADFPMPITAEVMQRGHSRYDIFCSPCHGFDGTGNGMIVQRGYTPPPSLADDRLRAAAPGHFVDVMTTGTGSMPSYAAQVDPVDRWAIAAYVRALQLSQHATLDDVPPDQRAALEQQQ